MRNCIREKKKKILVVDDEPFNQMAVINLLRVLGVQDIEIVVYKAINGQEAVDMVTNDVQELQYSRFDLIFMDYNMPVLDGCEATAQIRQFLYINNLV